ncbi:MAG TPA: DUF2380 domain-containing protein [Reyranella sp.]|nr:DUF2380 domain-containing protein [Reyranella sp.]
MHHSAFLLIPLLLAAPVASAAEPVKVAVAEIDFQDNTGAPEQKPKAHVERAKKFGEALRKDLGDSGQYKIVPLDCGKDPCSVAHQAPEDLIAAAKNAGARILVYGGVRKLSPVMQNLQAQAVDIEAAKLVFDRAISLRGDDAKSWERAERDLAEALLKSPLQASQ